MCPPDLHSRGSWAGFDEVFERYHELLVRRLTATFTSKDLSEDAVQEAFYRALKHWTKLASSQHLDTWLLVVARNVARDTLRRMARSRLAPDVGTNSGTTHPTPALAASLEHLLTVREEWLDTVAAIHRLPRQYREVLIDYCMGFSLDEIATRRGLSIGTVKSRLHRARSALRRLLGEPNL